MRIVKRFAVGVFVIALVLLVAVTVFKLLWDSHYYDGYDAALPLNAFIRQDKPFPDKEPKYRRLAFTFEGLAGQAVPALAAYPLDDQGPFPCLVFLHGIGQEKEFLDEIAAPFVEAGFAIVTFDQYMRGERKLQNPGKLAALLAFRRGGALTVIETRRLLDYLQTRDDVAHDRIYLLGASYGAITGSTAAAFDERIRAVVLCYGGGNFRYLLGNEEAAQMLGALAGPAKAFLAWLLAPSDPVQHVAAISPRPVLFQNGTHDSVIGRPAAEALHAAGAEPKEIIWYDSDHVGLDEDHTWKVIHDAIDWVKKQDDTYLSVASIGDTHDTVQSPPPTRSQQ
jgi:dienelactone hydrolase